MTHFLFVETFIGAVVVRLTLMDPTNMLDSPAASLRDM